MGVIDTCGEYCGKHAPAGDVCFLSGTSDVGRLLFALPFWAACTELVTLSLELLDMIRRSESGALQSPAKLLSDQQLHRFRMNPANKGTCLR